MLNVFNLLIYSRFDTIPECDGQSIICGDYLDIEAELCICSEWFKDSSAGGVSGNVLQHTACKFMKQQDILEPNRTSVSRVETDLATSAT